MLFKSFCGIGRGRHRIFAIHELPDDGRCCVSSVLFLSALKLDLANHTVILDAAVIPLSDDSFNDDQVREFVNAMPSSDYGIMFGMWPREVDVWEKAFPAWAERCRIWEHSVATCDKMASDRTYHTDLLCSCGIGKVPRGFIGDELELPHLDYVLENYVTRIAVSPCFAVPYLECISERDPPVPKSRKEKSTTPRGKGKQPKRPMEDPCEDISKQRKPESPPDAGPSNGKGKKAVVSRCNYCGWDHNKDVEEAARKNMGSKLWYCKHCKSREILLEEV